MTLKWNYKKHAYETYVIPDDWNVTLIESSMDKMVDCASCGTALPYGQTFTSKTIHNGTGLGYCVCEKCYVAERKAEKAEQMRKNMMAKRAMEGKW